MNLHKQMHLLSLLFICAAVLMAGCAGNAAPTVTPPPTAVPEVPTASPTSEAPAELPTQTSGPAPTAFLPPPGTLGAAVVTDEPAPGDREGLEEVAPPSGFDQISFEQTGGPANVLLRVEVQRSGEVTINGEAVAVAEGALEALANYIDEISLFSVQGVFIGPAPRTGEYRYRLLVISGENARSFELQEGYIPQEIMRLIATILDLGR